MVYPDDSVVPRPFGGPKQFFQSSFPGGNTRAAAEAEGSKIHRLPWLLSLICYNRILHQTQQRPEK